MPIAVPSKVKVELKNGAFAATGPKGTLSMPVHPDIKVAVAETEVLVTRPSDHRRHRALHGMTRAIIQNMVTGVSAGVRESSGNSGRRFRRTCRAGNS